MIQRTMPLALALAVTGVLSAQPAHAEDDRFTLRLGAMVADADGELRGSTVAGGRPFRFAQDFDFGSKETVPRIEGLFRFSERNRLLFNYFGYDKDRRATLGETISFDDVTIPAGSFAKAKAKFELASVMYDYAVVETSTLSLGVQVGVEYAKLETRLYASAGPYVYDQRSSDDGYAPVLGLRLTSAPSEHWRFVVQGQYLNTDWGNFDDYEGDISRANALAEYRFTKSLGVYVGYDWFKLDVDRKGRDGIVGLDQRFKGPIAGVTVSF